MGKIICLMGKSSTGKDTIYKRLLEDPELHLKKLIPYTTRPIREGEQEGTEYHFVDEERLQQLEAEGRIVELRAYDTVYGVWKYFTVREDSMDLEKESYAVIGTLDSWNAMKAYFGEEHMLPVYVEVEDGERLSRALARERQQVEPKYTELCRRFLADTEDFSEERLRNAGITEKFENQNLEQCLSAIKLFIQKRVGICYNERNGN